MGRVRTNNEDNFCFGGVTLEQENPGLVAPLSALLHEESICFGVFDGMGGAADGQVASYLSAQAFRRDGLSLENGGEVDEDFFLAAVEHMNTQVVREAERRNNNMGSTAVMLGLRGDTVYVCNVGDSRAYRLREDRLAQITMDHVEELTPAMTAGGRKARLSQCIGIPPEEMTLEPYIARGTAREGDIFLLCSDGVTDMLADGEIGAILRSGQSALDCVERLVDGALRRGGRDNTTAIVIRVLGLDGAGPEEDLPEAVPMEGTPPRKD